LDLDGCATGGLQFDICPLGFDGDLTLSDTLTYTYDTSKHELSVNGAMMPVTQVTVTTQTGEVDGIVAHDVRLTAGAQLRAIGPLPFAIVASGSITLEDGALIDVSNGGAGARTSCESPPMPGGDNTGGANDGGGGGGGGGGGYGAAGGKGGDGNADGSPQAKPKGGGGGMPITMPMGPVGGCPGERGGSGISGVGPGGLGGLGGGALYLVAADRIEFGNMAALMAGGGGGGGGGQKGAIDSGGGGGGSGGMLLLEAPHIIGPQAQVVANGGGGGEGADVIGLNAHVGKDGQNGSTLTSPALGGADGAADGADGGRGGSLEMPEGEAVTIVANDGGGGGGGGVGFVHIVSFDAQLGTVSPAAQ